MFKAAGLTISDVLIMITGVCLRYNLSNSAKQAILQLIKILAGPKFVSWNVSNYNMLKQYSLPDDKALYTFYCSTCYTELMDPVTKNNFQNQTRLCDKCNTEYQLSMQSPNYFVHIDISYQIKMLLQNKDILSKLLTNLKLIDNNTNSESFSIYDIYDGELYKKLRDIKSSQFKILTLNFNTDGAALFHSSKTSIWPVQLIINEFPVELRFKNIILVALWISQSEPKPAFMNLYFSTLVKSANKLLKSGITIINNQNQSIKFKFVLFCASVDSVARPIMQNRMQYNAFQGCSWCYAYSRYVKGAMRYPMFQENPELRSHESHKNDVYEVTKLQKIVRGVKGESELMKMPLFDSVWGYPVDYMHGILLGVTKQMWNIWIMPGHKFSLTAQKRLIINKRLRAIKPPHEIHRIPRDLISKAKWKATEWRSWLLFYSYPCLCGVLENTFLQSFLLLVQSVYILLKTDISEENLLQCELDLVRFVGECEILYGEEVITFNMHSLLHLVQSVRKSGPLWATSTFPYESNIFYFKQYVNGPKGVQNQIIEKHLQLMTYRHSVATAAFNNDDSYQYCKTLFEYRRLTQYTTTKDGIVFSGHGTPLINITDSAEEPLLNGLVFNRCMFKGIVFHSTLYDRPKKTDDTIIKLKNDTIVQITKFILIEERCCMTVRKIITAPIKENVPMLHLMKVVKKKKNIMIISMEEIKQKMIFIDVGECYVCELPNTIELQ